LRWAESNRRPSDYESNELPTAPQRDIVSISGFLERLSLILSLGPLTSPTLSGAKALTFLLANSPEMLKLL
jgi:hypothetical protein